MLGPEESSNPSLGDPRDEPLVGANADGGTSSPRSGLRITSARGAKIALVGVIAVFIVLGTIIAFRTPAYESADEPSHVDNIETMVAGHWYGMNSKCRFAPPNRKFCTGAEAHQAPLYYLVLAAWQKMVGVPARPPFDGAINPAYFAGKPGLFLHHTSSDHRFLLWLRLPNVLFGALTVLVAYLAVRLVSRDPWTPVVAAALVAFMPHFVFLSSFVTNDNLADLLGAVLVLVSVRYAIAPSRRRMLWVGAALGLLVTTKLSTLPLFLVLAALATMVVGWRRRVAEVALGLGSALVVCGWYLVQNTVRYGDPLAQKASARYLAQVGGLGTFYGLPYRVKDPISLVLDQVPRKIVSSFWYQSDWSAFHWPLWVNLAFFLATAAALAGLIGYKVAPKILITLTTLTVSALLAVWGVSFQTATYEAKYAMVALVAMAALAALGLERWRLPVRFLLPAIGLIGTGIAVQQNVLAVHW